MPDKSAVFSRWRLEMRRSKVFHAGERVGVAVSGGPDSVLLLDFMMQLAREQGLLISVVHFNHRLRGQESDEDERFVRQLAHERRLDLDSGAASVAETARLRGQNLEATARELRYRFFLGLITQGKMDEIATAHTANDQAETVLLRLFRGTGTKGLGGVYPLLEGKIVRPFLGLTRQEIEREVESRMLAFRTDSSNQNMSFRRNRIRMELLPLIEREYSPEAVRLLAELAARARDDEALLEELAREKAKPWRVRENDREKIPLRALEELPPAIIRRVLRQMVLAVRGTLSGVTHRHVEDLRRFSSEGRSGHSLILAGGLVARKEFDWLILEIRPPQSGSGPYSYSLKVPGVVFVPEIGASFEFKIVRAVETGKEYNRQGGGSGLDLRKVRGSLVLRNWRSGDRFQPTGGQRAKKLKELFRERRIAAGQRRLWPVLESSGEILWVKGFPPAKSARAVEGSRKALIVVERATASSREESIETKKETA